MFTFQCPSCQAKLQAAEANAGKKIRCPKCQQVAVVPQPPEEVPADAIEEITVAPTDDVPTAVTTAENAKPAKKRKREDDDVDDADDRDDERPRSRRRQDSAAPAKAGLSVAIIVLIVCGLGGCCIVVPILIALLVPAVQKVREAAARTQSTNNLKQIGLAFHSFHDVNKRLPFNGTRPAVGGDPKSGSWGFQILPYMEQQGVYATANRTAGIAVFMDPGRSRPAVEIGRGAWSDYFYNNYLNNPLTAASPKTLDAERTLLTITDGTSNTILVGHGNIATTQYMFTNNVTLCTTILDGGTLGTMRAGNNGKINPTGVMLGRDSANPPGIGNWGGPFPHGALMTMGDGSVRTFPYSTAGFGQFLTPAGGEAARLPDF